MVSITSVLKKWMFGDDFKVGEKVYWDNTLHTEFAGVYVVTGKRDSQGYVSIYNDKMLNRKVHCRELTLAQLKLFTVSYLDADDGDYNTTLSVGYDAIEVHNKMSDFLASQDIHFISLNIAEVNVVDGYKITLTK